MRDETIPELVEGLRVQRIKFNTFGFNEAQYNRIANFAYIYMKNNLLQEERRVIYQ